MIAVNTADVWRDSNDPNRIENVERMANGLIDDA